MTNQECTTSNVFDGIALMALANYGPGDYYNVVLAGIAKMREVDASVVSDQVSAHLKHLTSLVAPLLAQLAVVKLVEDKLDDDLKAKIEELQKPVKVEYLRYCAKELALTESTASDLMNKMVARGTR